MTNVLKDKEAGADWQKIAVKETTGFAVGALFGIGAGGAVVSAGAALGAVVALTPVGWGIIIVGSLVAGFAASKARDIAGKALAEEVYNASSSTSWWD